MDDLSFSPWLDAAPSIGRLTAIERPHGMHCQLEVLGLGVLEVTVPYAKGAAWRLRMVREPAPEASETE